MWQVPQEVYVPPQTEPVAVTIPYEVTHAALLADVIYEAEGLCDTLHGQSGEYGCYQYQARTWKAYSTIVMGEAVVQTKENERYITEQMIQRWILEGVSDRGIFLTWNQGTPGPDCYRGINQHGVPYDSCEYADKALHLLHEKEQLLAQSSP